MASKLPKLFKGYSRAPVSCVINPRSSKLLSKQSSCSTNSYHSSFWFTTSSPWSPQSVAYRRAAFSTFASRHQVHVAISCTKTSPHLCRPIRKEALCISKNGYLYHNPRLFSTATAIQQQQQIREDDLKNSESGVTTKRATEGVITTSTKISVPDILNKANPLKIKEAKENIYTLPNFLTFSRLIAAPAIGYAILTSHPQLALGLFAYAGTTDLVDGYLARRFNSQTVVGTILDPMADKTLMTTVVVCLTIQGILPTWLAVIILGRDIALAISAIYFRWISLPPPKTFSRYWDFSLPSAEVRPTEISKINTFLQLLLVGNAMLLPTLPATFVDAWNLYGIFEGWEYLVASTTIWSGLSYVFSKDAVKILSEKKPDNPASGKEDQSTLK